MKLLCICPIGIGNYLLCYPAWANLRRWFPDAELHLLALRKPIIDLAQSDTIWTSIHHIEPTRKQGTGSIIRFIAGLRAEKYTASISFFPSNTWQYNLLPFIAGIKRRIAFSYPLKKAAALSMLNTDSLAVDPTLHDVEQNIRIAAHFGNREPSSTTVTFPQLFTEEQFAQVQSQLPDPSGMYIALHPGSSAEHGMDAKRWPPERFGQLADRICGKLGATALIFGGPDESALKEATAAAMKHPCTILPPQALPLTAALIKHCRFCLANDSGLMHLAACCQVPVIALFGPTDEQRNGPWGNNHRVLRKPMQGFPLWTAANVGQRSIPAGLDPQASLRALTVDEAWKQCDGFIC